MDPDYIAFRALVRHAESDPVLAAELARRLATGRPLRDLMSLASSAAGLGPEPEPEPGPGPM